MTLLQRLAALGRALRERVLNLTIEAHTPRHYWPAVAIFVVLSAAIFYARLPVFTSLRGLAFDAYQQAEPLPAIANSPIQVVAIDEASLARVGQWPWSRATMAELTRRLGDAGAAAIVYDIMFAEPDRSSPDQILAAAPPTRRAALRRAWGPTFQNNDAVFAAALAAHPTVLAASLHADDNGTAFPMRAGVAVAGDDPLLFLRTLPGAADNLAPLSEAAAGTGFMNWLPDGDQILRRAPLLMAHHDQVVPSLSLEALRVALGASTYIVRSSNANGAEAFSAHTGIESIKVGAMEIPTDATGQVWVRYRHYNPDEAVSAWRVLDPETDLSVFQGAIVLIGASAPGLMDLRATPLDAAVPGVDVHRQILEQIVNGNFLERPDYAPGWELLAALFVILILAFAAPRLRPPAFAGFGFGVALLLAISGFTLFARANYLFDPVFPIMATTAFGAAATTYFYQRTAHQRSEIRRAFSQYVSPSVVRELTAHPERLKLGGEVRELTIFVCDIRNFSTIAEGLSAEELTAFINSFLTPLSDIIIESGGTIDKYMGDAIMAFWNAPLDQPDHATRACRASRQILARMDELNRSWRADAERAGRAFEDVRIGIGINTGECCVGNLGSERRFDYSAIGDAVNIASRLEGLCKIYGVALLVSEETLKQTDGRCFVEADLVRVKGRRSATRVFTSLSDNDIPPAAHDAMLKAYRDGDSEGAARLLSEIEPDAPAPLAALYRTYRERLDAARLEPTGAWDGVYDPDRK